MSSRKYGDPKRRKSTKEKGHDRRQNSCRRSSRAQTRAKVSKKRERRAGEKNIPIIRVIAKSFAPSFESLAKWLRNSPACEQPCNFSLTCEILLFLTHASFHMRKFAKSSEIGVCAVYWGIFGCRFMAKHLTMFGLF